MDAAADHDVTSAGAAALAAITERLRAIEQAQGVTPAALAAIMAELRALAARADLLPAATFPPPPAGEPAACRYKLRVDPDPRFALYLFALYLNAPNSGHETRPRDHTTRAVVVAVEGEELNRVCRHAGRGLVVDHEVVVAPGRGIALMPDDIHSIHTGGTTPSRHLHMYGRTIEVLAARRAYDPATGEAMPSNRHFMRPGATARV